MQEKSMKSGKIAKSRKIGEIGENREYSENLKIFL
jgi:hypothetical protein